MRSSAGDVVGGFATLRRVFHIDVQRCACGGQPEILAAIEEPLVIVSIPSFVGLPARAPQCGR